MSSMKPLPDLKKYKSEPGPWWPTVVDEKRLVMTRRLSVGGIIEERELTKWEKVCNCLGLLSVYLWGK